MAEKGLPEADFCPAPVHQHVPSWTTVCHAGITFALTR